MEKKRLVDKEEKGNFFYRPGYDYDKEKKTSSIKKRIAQINKEKRP